MWFSQPNFKGGEDVYFMKVYPVQVSDWHPKREHWLSTCVRNCIDIHIYMH